MSLKPWAAVAGATAIVLAVAAPPQAALAAPTDPDHTEPESAMTLFEVPVDPQPDPALSPEEVVRIQVGALARNDDPEPDAGIGITWRFASPANKRMTGPLPRFVGLVKNPAYGAMIGHRAAMVESARVDGQDAVVRVLVQDGDGDWIGYQFALSLQQDPPYSGCWMTDSVQPFPVTWH